MSDNQQIDSGMPMVEIFGGMFALLLVLFLLINLLSESAILERLESSSDEGLYRVGWGASGEGFTVIAFPEELRIIETGETVGSDAICDPGSPFVSYVRRVYRRDRQQLIFAILERGVATMAKARTCMMQVLPGRRISIGWIIASDELLKSISLQDIPPHIRQAVE